VRRLFSVFAVLFLLNAAFAVAAAPQTKKPQRVAFDLRGRVEDSHGTAVSSARVILLGISGRAASPRQTRSDKNGEWLFTQVKPGRWKIQAFDPEAMSEIYNLTISWRNDRQELLPVILKLDIKAAHILAEGKNHLYNHQWEAAHRAFDFFVLNFANHALLEEALYWNAYAGFRQARDQESGAEQLRRRALMMIERMISDFPEGPWSDDARVLRLDLWCDQFRAGEREEVDSLVNAADPAKEGDSRVRCAAIEILIPIKPDFAWEALRREIAATPSAKMRGDLLLLLTRFPSGQAVSELERIVREDPDSMVKAKAGYWLQRLNRSRETDASDRGAAKRP